ncbi:hypothetical protein L873DRAFT_1761819 [Choiromyces venosus 120613-1]|uniref:Uncharacterized protein n=1 Tax=Choiromyces venosus 120613-1 TaxID=1336337 RepID=A0A3N4K072_9PEZI|nr:hypothetical protein L873DRAFT_1761819 [Choiromyces venosus 120613-1]
MGFTYGEVRKSVNIDGHEREDVVKYWKDIFLPLWDKGEKPIVFITHDESTFNANDGKCRIWKEEGKQPLQAKSHGQRIMVSGFLTPGRCLKVPDTIPDEELFRDLM